MDGKRIKQIRKNKNITQDEIAKKIGVSKSTYCTWEKGLYEPSIENLIRIAEILNTNIDYILKIDKNISEIEQLYYPLNETNRTRVKAYIKALQETQDEIEHENQNKKCINSFNNINNFNNKIN
jgi:transcriptional regulator with XRE-family HTH domain